MCRIPFCRYAPAKSYLLVWAKTFAMYHNIPNDEAKEVVSKYMLKMHNMPESKANNAVYGMPLVPWDDHNIPNIYHMIENSPKGMKIDSPSKAVMEVGLDRCWCYNHRVTRIINSLAVTVLRT